MGALAETTDRFTGTFGSGRGQGARALADPDGADTARREAARISEAWQQGHRSPFFAVLRSCQVEVKTGTGPALQDLIADVLERAEPWEESRGLGLCEALCDLAGTRLAVCDHVLSDGHGRLHQWPEGDLGPRSLVFTSGETTCGQSTSGMVRAARGLWALHGARRCTDCMRPLAVRELGPERARRVQRELDEWAGSSMAFELALVTPLAQCVYERLSRRVRRHPHLAGARFDAWCWDALSDSIRAVLVADAAGRADQRPLLARALGGRYEQPCGYHRSKPLAELARSLESSLNGREPERDALRLRLTKRAWSQLIPRPADLNAPEFPGKYAAAVELALGRRLARMR